MLERHGAFACRGVGADDQFDVRCACAQAVARITRMINFNTDQSPFRKDANFTMFPGQ